jgi:hypothetical protein
MPIIRTKGIKDTQMLCWDACPGCAIARRNGTETGVIYAGDWREYASWNVALKELKVPDSIAFLIRRMVSR